jgi:Domain of unknown function (DUF1844)
MFIDQLGMIQEKTRGNLSNEESTVLRNALSSLQMAFVEASESGRGSGVATPPAEAAPDTNTVASPDPPAPATDAPSPTATESESKKKFSKSYGA